MTDDFDQLERILRGLPLRRPPGSLDRKVLRRSRVGLLLWIGGGVVAAAAGILFVVLVVQLFRGMERPIPPVVGLQGEQSFEPVQMTDTISHVTYEGLFVPDEQTPLEVFRRLSLERTWLVDEQTGYTVETTTPHQEVILIDAEMY